MAQISDDIGLPTVEPSTRGIDVNVSPEAFGAGIGQAFQHAGQQAEQFSVHYDQIAADNASNNYNDKITKLLYGDPNDPDQPGFYNMKGADAMHAYKSVQQQLDQAAQEQRDNLDGARAKFEFDQDTRRTRFLEDQKIGMHYSQQQTEWGIKTNEDKLTAAQNMVALNPQDPGTIALALRQAREATIGAAQLTRGRDFDPAAEIEKADQLVRLKQLETLRVQDPKAAWDLLQGDGGKSLRTLPQYATLAHEVQNDVANQASATKGDARIQEWSGKAAQSVQPPAQQQRHSPVPAAQYNAALNSVDPQYRDVVGYELAGETHKPADMAGPKGDYHVAGPGQFTTAQWKTVTGQDIAPENVGVAGKDPRLDPNASIQTLAAEAKHNRDTYFKAFGREPTAGDLTLMHQQGTAGGMALFHALINNPNAPATNYVRADALTGNNIPANATVAQAVRGISDYYVKGGGGSFGGGGATGQYTSQSDFLQAHKQEAVEQFRNDLADDPAFAGRDDLMDRAVTSFEIRYQRQIRDQSAQYLANAHQLTGFIMENHATSDNDIMAANPQMAQMLMQTYAENPEFTRATEAMYKANAAGQARGYGFEFSNMLDHVMAPAGDPNAITDPAKIMAMVGAGENSPLTNTGAGVLVRLLQSRSQPGGEGDISQLRNYLAQAKPIIDPFTKPELGQTWPQGQQKYARFVGEALKLVAAEREQGQSMSQILAKGGEVDKLLGQSGLSLDEQRKGRGQIVHDAAKAPELAAQAYLKKSIDPPYLLQGIKDKKISPVQASMAVRMGARSRNEIKAAYDAGVLTREDATIALGHLGQYHRNFWGQPEQ